MRRLLLGLALALGIAAAPAQAGIAIIAGTGTGGTLATGQNTSGSSLTATATTTADVPPGNLIVVMAGQRASFVFTGCTDSAGNTYSLASSKLGTSNSGAVFYTYSTIDLPNGGTVTCTNTSLASKSVQVVAFSGTDSSPLDAATPAGTTATGTAISVGPTGTLACPGGGAGCEVVIGAFNHLSIGTVTEDAAFTSLGISSNSHMGYEIVSATTPITYAPSNNVSQVWVALLPAFKAATGGASGAGQRQPLLGVSN